MERIAPAPKDKSASFLLPDMKDAVDASKAASSVLTAVSESELTPIEGRGKINLINFENRKIMLIDESYNSSPDSLKKSLENLLHYKKKNNLNFEVYRWLTNYHNLYQHILVQFLDDSNLQNY